jgi:hypothetical protein
VLSAESAAGRDDEVERPSWLGRLLRILLRALLFAFLFGFTIGTLIRCSLERAAGPPLQYLG